ncbi:hypothetical protein ACCS53_39735, partial [Rhizobium ruizarguesonis]
TLFFRDTATTRDINKAQIHAWKKGIKTIYYIRLLQMALFGICMAKGTAETSRFLQRQRKSNHKVQDTQPCTSVPD